MKRITKEQVVEAFEKVGAKPVKGSYVGIDDFKLCACGLGAVFLAENEIEVETQRDDTDDVENINPIVVTKFFDDNYGVFYRLGFVHGFDGDTASHEKDHPDYKAGYEDGKAAYEAVTKNEIKLWARVGVTISVDKKLFKENQEEAVKQAFLSGNVKLDGETYFPEEANELEIEINDMDFGNIRLTGEEI